MNINKFLDKNINDITVDDLLEYFSVDQEETSTIEFKSGNVGFESIYKEVCAFLNTNGGILIIGAPEKSKNRNKEIYKGDLIPSKIIKSSFILSQKISSYIVPAGLNIEIKELDYKEGKIYILCIPQSKYPPHQNSLDGVYYIRLESETTKSPHGLIQALFNKRQYPLLKVELLKNKDNTTPSYISFVISNESIITAVKGGYIINVYGVKSFSKASKVKTIKQSTNVTINLNDIEIIENNEPDHFTFKDSFETLNKGLFFEHEFLLEPYDSNYLVSIVAWAKDTELKYYLFVINPKEDKAIFKTEEMVDDLNDLFIQYNIKSCL